MTEPLKKRVSFAPILLGLIIGLWVGYGFCSWKNSQARKAAVVLNEGRFLEGMSEEYDEINRYWDSKPEVARALLEHELRAHKRLLETTRRSSIPPAILTEDVIRKDMGMMHIRVAILCRRMHQPDCVSENLIEAMQLTHWSSNDVWTSMDKLEDSGKKHRQVSNE
ncbi:MAG TPA: hypothetical protein VNL17_16750 [Verrucomicrobiae bacterium]|nr:hypothetical protein [Verrucomicrobiae bacterium]